MGSCCSTSTGAPDTYQLQKRSKNHKKVEKIDGPAWIGKRGNANKVYKSLTIKISPIKSFDNLLQNIESGAQKEDSSSSNEITLPSTIRDNKNFSWFGSMRPLRKSEIMEPNETSLSEGPILGRGSFGEVKLARNIKSKYFAMKRIDKSNILKDKKNRDRFVWELSVMKMVDHPFISYLFYVYQDLDSVCLIMDYHSGGELFNRLRNCNKFSENESKFYAAQIALAIAYLHDNNIIYRDLKPENIMLDYQGNVKLIDFGFAEQINPEKANQCTGVCGTAMYLAPELAAPDASPTASGKTRARLYGMSVDWWAFGCVVFEMVSGNAPFGDQADMAKYEILQNITGGKVSYPRNFSQSLTRLLKGLLIYPPNKRLNWQGVQQADWFKAIDWLAILNCDIVPPWIPMDEKPGGHKNFLKWEPKKTKKNDVNKSSKKSIEEGEGELITMDPLLMKFDDIPFVSSRRSPKGVLKTSANAVSAAVHLKNEGKKSPNAGQRKSHRIAVANK